MAEPDETDGPETLSHALTDPATGRLTPEARGLLRRHLSTWLAGLVVANVLGLGVALVTIFGHVSELTQSRVDAAVAAAEARAAALSRETARNIESQIVASTAKIVEKLGGSLADALQKTGRLSEKLSSIERTEKDLQAVLRRMQDSPADDLGRVIAMVNALGDSDAAFPQRVNALEKAVAELRAGLVGIGHRAERLEASRIQVQKAVSHRFTDVPKWATLPDTSGTTVCALTAVDDDEADGECQIRRTEEGIWQHRAPGGSEGAACVATCLWLGIVSDGKGEAKPSGL